MIKKITIENSLIVIETDKGAYNYDFKDKIEEYQIHRDKIYIRLNMKSRYNNRNIFCLGEKGNITWQVQDPDTFRQNMAPRDAPFSAIFVGVNSRTLLGQNFNSHDYTIDLDSGKIIDAKWSK